MESGQWTRPAAVITAVHPSTRNCNLSSARSSLRGGYDNRAYGGGRGRSLVQVLVLSEVGPVPAATPAVLTERAGEPRIECNLIINNHVAAG